MAVALTGLAGVAACVWAYLLAGHGMFWRTDQRLPRAAGDPERWPEVVAVVPARNEAGVLPATLPALLAQDYPGRLRVVLVDDGSTDGTAGLARRLARGADRELRVVAAGEPPAGWAGKVWAMSCGARAASEAGCPAYLLFTDADIACDRSTVTALVRAAVGDDRDLVSQLALLRTATGWERALVPAFAYFFAQLYPFRWVNRPGRRTAAAAGGCMLVRRRALDAAGGLPRIAGARIDDVALARLLGRPSGGGRIWLGFTASVVSRRDYPGLAGVWTMVARNAYTQLRYSPLLLACTLSALIAAYAVPPAAATTGLVRLAAGRGGAAARTAGLGITGWALMSASYVPVLRLYGLSAWRAPSLPLVAVLYAAMTVDSARRHRAGRGGMWKGRATGPAAVRGPATVPSMVG